MMTPFEWVVGDSSKDHTVTALPPTAAQPPRYTTLRGTTPPLAFGARSRLARAPTCGDGRSRRVSRDPCGSTPRAQGRRNLAMPL